MRTNPPAGPTSRLRRERLLAIVLVCASSLATTESAWPATYTWSSSAATSNWSAASNWGGTVPGSSDVGRFAAASYTSQPTLTNSAAIGGIWDTGSGSVTIDRTFIASLSLYGATIGANANTGIEVDAEAGSMTINAPLVLQNNQQWINNSAHTLGVTSGLSGSGSLTKTGSGALSLSWNSSLDTLNVNSGALLLAGGSLATNNENVGVSGAAVIQTDGTNAISNNGALTLGVSAGASGTYSLAGGLLSVQNINRGSGSGLLNLSGGTLQAQNCGVPMVLSSSPTGASPVIVPYATFFGTGPPISGSGGITLAANGANGSFSYNGSNSYSGPTTISPGVTLNVNDPNALVNSTVVLNADYSLSFGGGTYNVGGLSGNSILTIPAGTTLVVGGNNQNTTFSGTILTNGPFNDGALAKSGTGTLTLTGTSSWTGGLIFDPGTIAFNSDAALGDPFNTITFQGNGTLQALASVVFSLYRSVTIGPGATATFDTHGNTLSIGSLISGPGSLTKVGRGNLVLYGADSYTGTTTVAGGTLTLDFNQAIQAFTTTNILNNASNSSPLALSGGTLSVRGSPGVSNSQQFAGLFVNGGASAIVLAATTGNSLLLSLGSITRADGGTIDFTLPGGAQSSSNGITTTTPGTNGILGAYATVAGVNWAAVGPGGGNITSYSGYTRGNLGALGSNAALNVSPTGTQTAITAADTFYTLNLTGAVGVSMSGAGSLTLAGGGLLSNTTGTISGGTLRGSSGTGGKGELVVITPQSLTIASVIADNGGPTALTKAGSAALVLSGSNSFSGGTLVEGGKLMLTDAAALPDSSRLTVGGEGDFTFVPAALPAELGGGPGVPLRPSDASPDVGLAAGGAAAPEPGPWALLCAALAVVAARRYAGCVGVFAAICRRVAYRKQRPNAGTISDRQF